MKLLFITEFFPDETLAFSGGVESRTFFTTQGLKKKHNVTVIARSKKHIAATSSSIFSRVKFVITATVQAIKAKADVIEGSNFVCYLPAFIAAKVSGARSVAWYADVYDAAWFTLMPPLVATTGFWLEKIGLHLPWDHVIAMSNATKTKLMQKGIPEHKISVIYGGVDVQSVASLSHETPYKHPTICTAARLVPYKHIDDLIRAFALVKFSIRHAQLIIMGDGPERRVLESLADQLQVASSVHFSGALQHKEVLKVMKRSHVFSLPSSVEGFGLASIEAAACGLPYVSADIPATREITRNGMGGYLYPVRDFQILAQKLVRLLTDAVVYQEKSQEVSTLAQNYDWKRIVSETESVYQSTLKT